MSHMTHDDGDKVSEHDEFNEDGNQSDSIDENGFCG